MKIQNRVNRLGDEIRNIWGGRMMMTKRRPVNRSSTEVYGPDFSFHPLAIYPGII